MIALTGGKTGGHIMPLLAIAQKLDDVCYIGSKDSLEEKLCKQRNISFIPMKFGSFRIFSCFTSACKLKLPNVQFIISTGGYVSVPVLLYAIWHRIPFYLLEENVIMGKTNHFFSFFAKKVLLTYELPKMKKKYEVVGLPLSNFKWQYHAPTYDILIIGGSLGSKPLCELALQLKREYRVCLIAGRYCQDYQQDKEMQVMEYSNELVNLMQSAKLIISRAGAATTYEIFSCGRPCILIPSMKTKKNHQYLNALYFQKKGCCKLVKEKDSKYHILEAVKRINSNPQLALNMIESQKKLVIRNSTERIITMIKEEIYELQ